MKQPNLHGEESVPLKEYVKHFPLTVTVYDAKDNVIRQEHIDYGNFEHRKWIGRVTFWACSQGYVVETQAKKE
jgi:hypothetical protein